MAAKSTEWPPGPTVCRCCLSEGCYKDISTEYFWMGKREVYADMLSETFDLSISYAQSGGLNSHSRLICEPCISRLRDAADFKRQVQECERTFTQYLDPGNSVDLDVTAEEDRPDNDIKIEFKEEKDDSDDEDFDPADFGDDDDYDELDDQPLTKLASKIPKKESIDALDNILDEKTGEKRKSSSKIKATATKKLKTKREIATSSKEKPEPKKKKAPEEIPKTSKWCMTAAERKNASLLLHLTTVTPFTYCLFPTTYKCLFCEEKHTEVQTILEHVRKHEIPDATIILRDYIKRGKRKVMVDISKLNCRLCDVTLPNLEDARKHLTVTHNAEFTDAECGMIAFNLETTNGYFQCHICLKSFYSFFLLNKHISVHYSNAVCESCGKSFVTYQRLAKHKETHKTGTHPCEDCNKIFPSVSRLKYHFNKVHGNREQKLAKCQKCLQRFEHHYEKIKHLKEVHGMEFNFKCEICSEYFKTKHSLNLHTVSSHLERLTCLVCQKTFNKKYVLKRHMAVHFLPRNYCCPLCKKWFRYEKMLKQHLKSHESEEKNLASIMDGENLNIKSEPKNRDLKPNLICTLDTTEFKNT